MTVYVDDYRTPRRVGRVCGVWSHLFAIPEDSAELHAIARRIGLWRKWCQRDGRPGCHYDVVDSRRRAAIAAGAESITAREGGHLRINWRRYGVESRATLTADQLQAALADQVGGVLDADALRAMHDGKG